MKRSKILDAVYGLCGKNLKRANLISERDALKNIVQKYKINCMDCEALSYVGQTKRKLSTRLNEYKNIDQTRLMNIF